MYTPCSPSPLHPMVSFAAHFLLIFCKNVNQNKDQIKRLKFPFTHLSTILSGKKHMHTRCSPLPLHPIVSFVVHFFVNILHKQQSSHGFHRECTASKFVLKLVANAFETSRVVAKPEHGSILRIAVRILVQFQVYEKKLAYTSLSSIFGFKLCNCTFAKYL